MTVSIALSQPLNFLQATTPAPLVSDAADFSALFSVEVATVLPVPEDQIGTVVPAALAVLPAAGLPEAPRTKGPLDEAPVESAQATDAADRNSDVATIEQPVADLVQTTLQAMTFLTEPVQPASALIAVPVLATAIPPNLEASPPVLSDRLPKWVNASLPQDQPPQPIAKATPAPALLPDTASVLPEAKGRIKSRQPELAAPQSEPKPAFVLDQPSLPTDTRGLLTPTRPAPTAPVEQLFAALSRRDPVERQWLETVMRDVSAVSSKTGDVRFRVEPEGFGRITIERTADRLDIAVSEQRSLATVEAARPQVLAGALALGVPVSASSVALDQSGARHRGDAPPRHQIDFVQSEEDREGAPSDDGRYA